ncbi:sugar porter family MFS transporter [Pseudodesulfovibrio tunisiensis]|uniref:sugar porter family MFS transporter n=1 Tax=Pseudodesulfovibrio tunisiensis TaxID=463192 RepID=UPI001FB4AE99|nr:sugar porter family MFS transporter [Pseudodesulfovibrio tunisiensis]
MTTRDPSKTLLVTIAGIAATGGLLFGFDTGVISGALLFIRQDFSLGPTAQEWVVSAVLLGCIAGAATSGRIADTLGRRKVIIATAVLFAAGSIWTSAATSIPLLIAGRVVIGLAIGVASFAVPLYISEISPPAHRGALVSLNQLLITIGIVASYLVDDLFAGAAQPWRYMFLAGVVPAIILGTGMLLLPETPRWLMEHDQEDRARAVLGKLLPREEAETELAAIRDSLARGEHGTLRDLLAPWMRPVVVIGAGIMFVQQTTGINTVIYYAPTIFEMAGFTSATTAITATVGVGLVNVFMTVVSIRLVDRLGRRPLLSAGLLGMIVSLVVLALAFQFESAMGTELKWVTVAALFAYIGSFAVSLGPIAWLLIAEIYPLHIRGLAMSLATLCNWVFNFAIASTFLTIVDSLGKAGAFWLYAGVGTLGWFFCRTWVPETKGVPLERLESDLRAGVPARNLGTGNSL